MHEYKYSANYVNEGMPRAKEWNFVVWMGFFCAKEPNRETQKESLTTSTDRPKSILFML